VFAEAIHIGFASAPFTLKVIRAKD